jgi:hypothetical protein
VRYRPTAVLSVLELSILRKNKTGLGAGNVCCGDRYFMKCKNAVICYVCRENFSNGIPCFYTYQPYRAIGISVSVHDSGFNNLCNPKNVLTLQL